MGVLQNVIEFARRRWVMRRGAGAEVATLEERGTVASLDSSSAGSVAPLSSRLLANGIPRAPHSPAPNVDDSSLVRVTQRRRQKGRWPAGEVSRPRTHAPAREQHHLRNEQRWMCRATLGAESEPSSMASRRVISIRGDEPRATPV